MYYTMYELAWLFFAYSFLGWILETIVGTINRKRFVNRGFVSGPICLVYGIAAVIMNVFLWELLDNLPALFLGCSIVATVIEWLAGKTLERLNQKKWWDYSGKKWNFDGYICLFYSLLWGVLGVAALKVANPVLVSVYQLLPGVAGKILIWGFLSVTALDMAVSMAAVFHVKQTVPRVSRWHRKLAVWTRGFGLWIVDKVSGRMSKAYPAVMENAKAVEKEGRFAEGCGFYKLFWLFFLGSFLGDIVETIFCRITMGQWISRSSLVWGPFSIVWGLALVIATALMYKDKDKPDRHIFMVGTLLGGAYEYICSVFTEIVFGKVFWDYSGIPFNLGGRINLLYCFFWGIAAVVWIKILYPPLSRLIEKIPKKVGVLLTWILAAFMAVNMIVSAGALIRYDSRGKGIPAQSGWERYMDAHFGDEVMNRIYPKAVEVSLDTNEQKDGDQTNKEQTPLLKGTENTGLDIGKKVKKSGTKVVVF